MILKVSSLGIRRRTKIGVQTLGDLFSGKWNSTGWTGRFPFQHQDCCSSLSCGCIIRSTDTHSYCIWCHVSATIKPEHLPSPSSAIMARHWKQCLDADCRHFSRPHEPPGIGPLLRWPGEEEVHRQHTLHDILCLRIRPNRM